MIKNKLSDLISIQLPDHIRESYPTFVEFLQAYYKFLETQQVYRNLETVRDVDETLDVFIDQLKKEYAVDFPQFAKDRQFLKNTPHISVAHGSEESYKFLFRKMFQKEVDIRYPREQLLTISDSKWVQDFSIFVKLTSGDILSLQNNVVLLNTVVNGISTKNRIYVKRVESVLTSESIYEIFINKDVYGKVLFGDIINQNGVVASVVNTTSSLKIKKAGFGFKVGQVFNIESDVGSGLTFKITEVTPLGGIKSTQLINYGINFKSTFSFDLPSTFIIGDVVETSLGTPIKITAYSSVQRYVDSGMISKQNYYTGDYNADYVGEVMTSFNSVSVAEEITANSAQLEVVLGTLAKYQGYYENSTGLVSSPDSVIQDNNYYQNYSYVLRIDEALASYKETVMSVLHPIGRKLFAEYVVDNVFELDYEVVEPVFRILLPLFSGIPTLVNILSELDLLINKPVASVQLVSSDDIYLFEKSTNITLSSFDDPTLLDTISGRVKGSFKTYLFDSLKASNAVPESDDYWLFEQPLSSSALPTFNSQYLFEKDTQSPQLVGSDEIYLFESEQGSTLAIPGSDDYWLVVSEKESVLPQQEFSLFYVADQVLNTSLAEQTFLAALETNRPLESTINIPLSQPALETARRVESFMLGFTFALDVDQSTLYEDIVSASSSPRLDYTMATIFSPPVTAIDTGSTTLLINKIFSPVVPPTIENVLSNVVVTGTSGQFTCTQIYFGQNVFTVSVTGTNTGTGSISGYRDGVINLYELSASNGSFTPNTFTLAEYGTGLPITTTPGTLTGLTFTRNNSSLNFNPTTQSFVINSDSGKLFFNPYIEDMTSSTASYFADETYLAPTRTF